MPFFPSVPSLPPTGPRTPGLAPRKVHLWLGRSPIARTVSSDSLRAWVETGEVASDLDGILPFLKAETRADFKEALSKRLLFLFGVAQLDEFVREAPVGVRLAAELAGVFNYEGERTDPAAPVRASLIALAARGKPFGVIDFLEYFPLEHIDIDVLSIKDAVDGSKGLVEEIKRLNRVHPE